MRNWRQFIAKDFARCFAETELAEFRMRPHDSVTHMKIARIDVEKLWENSRFFYKNFRIEGSLSAAVSFAGVEVIGCFYFCLRNGLDVISVDTIVMAGGRLQVERTGASTLSAIAKKMYK